MPPTIPLHRNAAAGWLASFPFLPSRLLPRPTAWHVRPIYGRHPHDHRARNLSPHAPQTPSALVAQEPSSMHASTVWINWVPERLFAGQFLQLAGKE
ncbi:hypothetical protein P171DRAFT_431470 [Karstenula rhodostoma CBS 690.94]|uniref:Uncharacterized protein n=1 Tax=Karstenula rhodostoma CBS 690.94 TaxID=1392251 RepID=A0A9P4UCS5_9PLEO|nr:hypothetical protein P171DRAFT_431470 [Karstenula rhodostoma CBS 690.94]